MSLLKKVSTTPDTIIKPKNSASSTAKMVKCLFPQITRKIKEKKQVIYPPRGGGAEKSEGNDIREREEGDENRNSARARLKWYSDFFRILF
jgi:hypothetical protein